MTAPARLVKDQGIATITLDRPHARNALSSELAAMLHTWFTELADDEQVGCIVLTGADPAFCAGLDLTEFRSTGAAPSGAGALIREVGESPVPVVAAVNGPAYTGGLELVLGCDFVIASERATFADTHVLRGLMPGSGMSYRLAEAVGVTWAKRNSYTGDPVSADLALRLGLAGMVVEHAELLPTAENLARQIAAAPRDGVRAMKQLYRVVIGTGVDEGRLAERDAQARWREAHPATRV